MLSYIYNASHTDFEALFYSLTDVKSRLSLLAAAMLQPKNKGHAPAATVKNVQQNNKKIVWNNAIKIKNNKKPKCN